MWRLALLAGLAAFPATAGAQTEPPRSDGTAMGPLAEETLQREIASADVRDVARWVARAGDNQGLSYVIIDKRNAKVFVFSSDGQLQGATPALFGLAFGDNTVPGIGQRRLSTMSPEERTTPAGRFVAALGHDLEQDVLWIDYDAALSLHRVIAGRPEERRSERLASATADDNRISYGCINVPAEFYDRTIVPAFRRSVGIVYILPESMAAADVFAMSEPTTKLKTGPSARRYPRLEDSRANANRPAR